MNRSTLPDPPEASDLLLVADVGGTRSRVLVAPAGSAPDRLPDPVVGPGANVRSSGPEALEGLLATIAEALAAASVPDAAARIRAGVLAISGAGPARHREIAAALHPRLMDLGLDPERVRIMNDLPAAFAAANVGGRGTLLLAGTGAVAVRFEDGQARERRDGMGWLLGDVGSAVWLGRRTLEAVAADIDGRGRRTALTERLGDVLDLDLRDGIDGPTGDPRQDLIRAVDPLSPADWGRFAPLPGAALPDPVAREILDTAIRGLMGHVRALDPDALHPVVLAGSVLCGQGPIHDELVTGLEARGQETAVVASGIPGAWRLAQAALAEREPRPRA